MRRDYLCNVVDLASRMARKDHGRQVPESIKGDEDAQAVFGIWCSSLSFRFSKSGITRSSRYGAVILAISAFVTA